MAIRGQLSCILFLALLAPQPLGLLAIVRLRLLARAQQGQLALGLQAGALALLLHL
jgi:hypothetical protein